MLFSLVIGLVTLLCTKSNATFVLTTDDQTDSVKTAQKNATDDYDKVFIKVQEPAEFPGGLEGWRSYLQENLKYPKKAAKNGTQGIVKVQVLLDKDGTFLEVKALNDPGDGLAEEAVKALKKGPKWSSAKQNGRPVKYRFVQTITFQLQ